MTVIKCEDYGVQELKLTEIECINGGQTIIMTLTIVTAVAGLIASIIGTLGVGILGVIKTLAGG